MKTGDEGIALIKRFEGCEFTAYPDPGTGGEPWTIGFGHTGGVKPGDVIDEKGAEELLRLDLEKFERCVDQCVEVELTQAQFDALVAFTFNVGCGSLQNSSLLKLVNAERFDAAAQQFGRWNRAGGKVLAGLTRRRAAEAELFQQEDTA